MNNKNNSQTSVVSNYMNHPSRLADVIAAIQVLGAYKFYKRSLYKWRDKIGGPPASSEYWFDIFKEHPEFFRFSIKSKNHGDDSKDIERGHNAELKKSSKTHFVSLVWRRSFQRIYSVDMDKELSEEEFNKLSKSDLEERITRRPLQSDEVNILINTAIELHARAEAEHKMSVAERAQHLALDEAESAKKDSGFYRVLAKDTLEQKRETDKSNQDLSQENLRIQSRNIKVQAISALIGFLIGFGTPFVTNFVEGYEQRSDDEKVKHHIISLLCDPDRITKNGLWIEKARLANYTGLPFDEVVRYAVMAGARVGVSERNDVFWLGLKSLHNKSDENYPSKKDRSLRGAYVRSVYPSSECVNLNDKRYDEYAKKLLQGKKKNDRE